MNKDVYIKGKRVLRFCGYPDWTFKKVKSQMESAKEWKQNKKRRQSNPGDRPQVVIPYVEKVSETVARVLQKYQVPVAVRPSNTLIRILVHPKGKQKEEKTECVHPEGRSMNQDEGSYTMSHVYDKVLAILPPDCGKNWKKNCITPSDEVTDRDRNVKVEL